MTSANVIDIDVLLAPIEGDNSAGSDIRQDASASSIYYTIKDARAGARRSERQLLMEDDPESVNTVVPEWATVLETAPVILTSQAKDLEVAAWYTEGLLRQYGLPGLRDGFRLIHGLVENYWDNLYPMPDEDGLETRLAPLVGLNGEDGEGTLMVPINKVALTEGYTYSPFATWHYEQALDIEKIADPKKKQARIDSGAVTLQMIEQAVQESSTDFFAQFKEDLDECIDAFASMTAALDERCGNESPPSSNIRNRLNRVKEVFGFLTKDMSTGSKEEDAQPTSTNTDRPANVADTGAASIASANVTLPSSDGDITSREEAHLVLLKVAEFFRSTEPHSPVSYALEQVVRWGRMSLPELLAELIADDRARGEFFKVTGIPIEGKEGKRRK
ncbi:MAG: type VI secretion system protein TssA [Gammaproteobacteria bacterium]|nr:type VI secretion system protein TssA [Gammaproteobacteria bacterium]